MIEFLRVLLFANTVLLTPSPIDVGQRPVDIEFDGPVSALTMGAGIEIDVSTMIDRGEHETIREVRDYMDWNFGKGAIRGRLLSDNNEIFLTYNGNMSVGEERVYLLLDSENQISLNEEFYRLTVQSNADLNDVKMLWRNYGK